VKVTAITFVLACFGIYLTTRSPTEVREEKPKLLPPENIEYFTLGYKDPMADLLWIRLIQDADFCEAGPFIPPSEGEYVPNEKSTCHKGWVYRMMNEITDLAPRFRIVYRSGGMLLSVVVDDREGARLLLEKSLTHFPRDWVLHYRAGYHYLAEVQNKTRAAEILIKAAKLGAPPWVVSLVGKILSESGAEELARDVLTRFLMENPNHSGNKRTRWRLEQIDKKLKKIREQKGQEN